MRYFLEVFNKYILTYIINTKSDARSFFDFPAKEKREIIRKAAIESNKMQQELIERYNKLYPDSTTITSPSLN